MDSKLPTHKDTGRENIVIFGDSISFGELVSPHRGWVVRLSARIEDEHGDRFLTVNTSINGNTTRMALERMAFDVQRYRLDMIVVQFGMNDCNCWQTDQGAPRVSEAGYRANLLEIVDRARRFGGRRLLLMTSHPTPHRETLPMVGASYEDLRRRYCGIVRDVARVADCGLIDVDAMLAGRPVDYLMPDGIHLNPLGHDLYMDLVAPPILEAARALPRRPT
ncbi:SGNH/GDSL hydrolase family protein [Magnetospirillum sp. SS-4]|uniref:SGNH/GDSL hydrolase family protein n=1 Tax=Magnetospirillum sp. SS-4 TaxID=2681465 RepID=UPI0013837A2B|nr:SGNH/GDSL hydrolase family protein [Magnetospirillum sp. SS-4]CAA7617710.1 Lipolytic enzyme, G-D-S-L [Magnetospirillum sp. SS-4]